jgi:hypothetical protein
MSLLLLPSTPHRRRHTAFHLGVTLLVVMLLAGYGLTMLGTKWESTLFVHEATYEVELAQREHWRRPGVFPDHEQEGYASFWKTTAVATLWFGAAVAVVTPRTRGSRWYRWGRLALILASLCIVAAFDSWYYVVEFPRLSPDLAAQTFFLSPWGIAGFGLMLVALAHYGGMLVTRDPGLLSSGPGGIALRQSPLALVGGLAFGVNSLVWLQDIVRASVAIVRSYFTGGAAQGPTDLTLEDLIFFLIFAPEIFLTLLLLPLAAKFIWQSFRGTEIQFVPKAIRLGDYSGQFALTLALLLVGLPCLRALGFAMWLGPRWISF